MGDVVSGSLKAPVLKSFLTDKLHIETRDEHTSKFSPNGVSRKVLQHSIDSKYMNLRSHNEEPKPFFSIGYTH